jgi:hypothetical protein
MDRLIGCSVIIAIIASCLYFETEISGFEKRVKSVCANIRDTVRDTKRNISAKMQEVKNTCIEHLRWWFENNPGTVLILNICYVVVVLVLKGQVKLFSFGVGLAVLFFWGLLLVVGLMTLMFVVPNYVYRFLETFYRQNYSQ